MLDTVILEIPIEKFKTLDPSQGRFPSWRLQSRTIGYDKHVKNWFVGNDKSEVYFPRLTGYTRKRSKFELVKTIYVEFSVAKLIYRNNLIEVEEKDFLIIIKVLRERLLEMGEDISEDDLKNAIISAFHPSKNILLSDGFTSSGVVRELAKINVNKKFDLTSVVFANDGASLQIRTESHSIIFYDKIADVFKDKNKAIDKDQVLGQRSLFAEIKKEQPAIEVLRIETRISKKKKVKEIMKGLGFVGNPTFKDIFKKDVCQKIVRWYWEDIIKGENLFLFELINSPKRLLRKILRGGGNTKAKQAIFLVGLSVLCKDDGGIRELREILGKYTGERNWYRLSDGTKLLNNITNKRSLHSWVQQIDDAINRFEAYKLSTSDVNKSKV
jgi:hypothetical protein